MTLVHIYLQKTRWYIISWYNNIYIIIIIYNNIIISSFNYYSNDSNSTIIIYTSTIIRPHIIFLYKINPLLEGYKCRSVLWHQSYGERKAWRCFSPHKLPLWILYDVTMSPVVADLRVYGATEGTVCLVEVSIYQHYLLDYHEHRSAAADLPWSMESTLAAWNK